MTTQQRADSGAWAVYALVAITLLVGLGVVVAIGWAIVWLVERVFG